MTIFVSSCEETDDDRFGFELLFSLKPLRPGRILTIRFGVTRVSSVRIANVALIGLPITTIGGGSDVIAKRFLRPPKVGCTIFKGGAFTR